MVLVSDGRVDAVGPVSEVMSRLDLYPKTGRFEAGAVLDARVHAHDEGHGLTTLAVAGGEITVPRLALPLGAAARIRIRARDVIIATSRPQGLSALNILPGRIAEIAALGSGAAELRLTLAGGASLLARLTRRSVEELGLVAGRDVFAVIKTVALDRHGFGPAAPGGADEVDA
jgi:molybdate transport system ATP-binding protein